MQIFFFTSMTIITIHTYNDIKCKKAVFFVSSVVIKCILLPLIGTTLGSGCVFFMKNNISIKLHRALLGFASGVMVAASVWSLIIPAVEKSSHLGVFSFLPVLIGFWLGVLGMLLLEKFIPEPRVEDSITKDKKPSMLFFAVTLHNLPEGMAVGVVLSALMAGEPGVTVATAVSLALGIAIQNFPEGSVISMPLSANNMSKLKAFFYGFVSGVVEAAGAVITIIFSSLVTPILPYMLTFAAGAMVYVTINELIPEMHRGKDYTFGTLVFSLGFSVMMCLDVALG